ncbi:MAG: permease prefix domain 2-containing transporter, partial [Bacteroidota bacterium]
MSKKYPPKWLDKFLLWYCAEELIEEIQGDLHEAYRYRSTEFGKAKAQWMYFLDVLKFFRPYSFEKYSRTKQYLPMFNNYIKIALRNLIKRKAFTALNLLGLSIGISSVLLVSLYLQHELAYDASHPQSENIYRLVNKYRDQTYTCMFFKDYYGSAYETQMGLLNHLKNYDEVSEGCHFVPSHSPIGPNNNSYVYVGDKKLIMKDFLYTNTGEEFQKLFPQRFLEGSPSLAFSQFDKTILSESSAEKMYGKDWKAQSILGNSIMIQDRQYIIGGVVEDVPGNVHYDFT